VRRPKAKRSTRARPATGPGRGSRATIKRRTTASARSRPRPRARGTAQGAEIRRLDLETLSKVALLELAKSLALRGRHRLSKGDLVRALRELIPDTSPPSDEPIAVPPSAPESAGPTDSEPGGLPWRYGVTELVALPVDPLMVYLYWEVTPDAVSAGQRALGAGWEGVVLVLRGYDVAYLEFDGTNAHHQFDTEVWGDVGNWYLHLWHPEQTLLFEIGWRARDGRFFAAARSNLVHTPRNAPCAGGEERWMTITDESAVPTPSDAIPTGSVPERDGTGHDELPWSASHPASGLASRRFHR